MSKPVIIIASLMQLQGTTGVQAHMREFIAFLRQKRVPHIAATPFHGSTWPLLVLFLAFRRLLEFGLSSVAVSLYREGHALLLGIRLRFLLRVHRTCVVYAQCPLSADVALRSRHNADQKVVLIVHFNVSQAEEWIDKGMIKGGSRLDKRIRSLESDVANRVDGLVFVSDFMFQKMKQCWLGVAAPKVALIPNFVTMLNRNLIRPEVFGRDLICIGSLEPRKNQIFLLNVIGVAKRRGRLLHLTLVGDGPDRPRLQDHARKLDIVDLVHFEGFSSEARNYIPGHRLYVHAAKMENLPVVILEAFSAGMPVLAGAVGGIPEIFENGAQGCFWPLDNVESACDVLLAVLDNSSWHQSMQKAAVDRFHERYEADKVAERLLAYLLTPSSVDFANSVFANSTNSH